MGLFSQAARTYDLIMNEIGQGESHAEGLAPLFHKTVRIDVIIQLTAEGRLLNISEQDKKNPVTGFMPVTEASAGRSSSIAPHPLIDDIKNLTEPKNVEVYLKQLKAWCDDEPGNTVINAVYEYVSGGTLTDDLTRSGIALKEKEKPSKKIIGWLITTSDELIKTWADAALIESYTRYIVSSTESADKVFCMISGEEERPITNIPKLPKIAKLISSNDSINFSYRGRFIASEEALTTGYITTQKAINVLSWLLMNSNFNLSLGDSGQLLCWRPDGLEVQKPDALFDLGDEHAREFPAYRKMLEARIRSSIEAIPMEKRDVVVTILNATSTGRGSIKYYSERNLEEFLASLAEWDLECCWSSRGIIKTPELRSIALSAYGIFDSEKGFIRGKSNQAYENALATLITRRIDNGRIPVEIVNALALRCEKLAVYIGSEADKNWEIVNRLLFTTCAVLRKYYIDHGVKEYKMTLDKDSKDRSYQWGRLLAVYEKIEKDAVFDGKSNDRTVTNATRMQSTFVRRPAYTASILDTKMRTAYFQRFIGNKVGKLVNHEKTIQEIMQKLAEFSESEREKPLKPSYLLGYYLQKASYYTKVSDTSDEE